MASWTIHCHYDEYTGFSWGDDYDDCDNDTCIIDDTDVSDLTQIVKRGSKTELIAFFELEKNKLLNVNSSVSYWAEGCEFTYLLHLAVDVPLESYHPDFVEYIILSQRNINKMNTGGYAPLHYAVLRSNTAAAQALIEAGADANLQDSNHLRYDDEFRYGSESFPLHMAVKDQKHESRSFPYDCDEQHYHQRFGPQNLDLIKLLLSSGANCNVLDGQGLAPLHYAVWADDMSAADILLESGADIDIQSNNDRVTPLFCVESQNMLLFLLSKKADQSLPDGHGETVLSHFIRTGLHKLSLTLLSDSSEDFCNKRNLLDYAFENRDKTAVKILINSGCVPRSEVYKLNIKPRYRTSRHYKNMIEAMDQIASNPSKLFDLCRIKIRNVLKTNIRLAVLDLELPEELRGAVCLKDLDFAQRLRPVSEALVP